MRIPLIFGIILIAVGVIALAYQGITYTSHKRVFDIGPLKGTIQQKKTIPLPPIAGGAAVAAGVVLVIVGTKQKA
jgi:hypothetical protein